MTAFTASNGVKIDIHPNSIFAAYEDHLTAVTLTPRSAQALREFFQHERDEELGRWRSKLDPNYYARRVSSDEVGALFVSGHYRIVHRIPGHEESPFRRVAQEYFEAHPEPKPWEDAKAGEIWELTAEGSTRNYAAIASRDIQGDTLYLFPMDDVFAPKLGLRAPVITAGRRIYPEEDAS